VLLAAIFRLYALPALYRQSLWLGLAPLRCRFNPAALKPAFIHQQKNYQPTFKKRSQKKREQIDCSLSNEWKKFFYLGNTTPSIT
jgi:hypothetical protein